MCDYCGCKKLTDAQWLAWLRSSRPMAGGLMDWDGVRGDTAQPPHLNNVGEQVAYQVKFNPPTPVDDFVSKFWDQVFRWYSDQIKPVETALEQALDLLEEARDELDNAAMHVGQTTVYEDIQNTAHKVTDMLKFFEPVRAARRNKESDGEEHAATPGPSPVCPFSHPSPEISPSDYDRGST